MPDKLKYLPHSNQNTAPPVTTDSESIWVFTKIDNDTVSAKLRIASYLNAQSDYEDYRRRLISSIGRRLESLLVMFISLLKYFFQSILVLIK